MNQQRDRRVPDHDPVCIECGETPELVGGEILYRHRPDLYHKKFYRCSCGAYVGCHPDSEIALGNPCGPETRRARGEAHAAIDPLWREGVMRRNEVYAELARRLGIERSRCHVAHMNLPEARRAREIAYQMMGEKRQK